MTWFRIDDQWAMHPKVQAAGLHGRALWVVAGSQCAARDADGVIDGRMVKMYAALAEVPQRKAVDALLASGLWHDATTVASCAACASTAKAAGMAPDDYYVHDFLEHNLDAKGKDDPVHRSRDLRRRRLNRNRPLKAAVRERDRDLCRYCGVLTVWGSADRRSKKVGELDHVDPWGANTLENVVVSCKGCNSDKKDRTPDEWAADGGRLLLPVPTKTMVQVDHDHGADPTTTNPDQNPAPLRVARDSGPGRVGSGSGPAVAGSGRGPWPRSSEAS